MNWANVFSWLVPLAFVTAVGASVGSLLNVVAYRMPLGMGLVWPPSACPRCGTRLGVRDNVPVLGWLMLGGRCRYCRSRISVEYPLVELLVAVLFGGLFALYYVVPAGADVLGVAVGQVRAGWAEHRPFGAVGNVGQTWPLFVCVAGLFACLVGMTLTDAKTYTIPMELTWVAVGLGVACHLGLAVWAGAFWGSPGGAAGTVGAGGVVGAGGEPAGLLVHTDGWRWAIPLPGEPVSVAAQTVLGALGRGLARPTQPQLLAAARAAAAPEAWAWIGLSLGGVAGVLVSNALLRAGLIARSFADYDQWEASAIAEAQRQSAAAAPAAGAAPTTPGIEPAQETRASDPELWIAYPHARREMVKEAAFLGPIVLLGLVGAVVTRWLTADSWPPLWLHVAGGVAMGYLIGGATVWLVRIGGSIAFNKEAMGMGDVHLMAAVGACLGWIDAVVAFFGAAGVGLAWVVLSRALAGSTARALPYGPFLAVSTVLVVLLRPWLEQLLGVMLGEPGPFQLP